MIRGYLRKEIEDLRNENRAQQMIITNLVFRHLLEVLPPRTAQGMSSTAKWSAFFENSNPSPHVPANGQDASSYDIKLASYPVL